MGSKWSLPSLRASVSSSVGGDSGRRLVCDVDEPHQTLVGNDGHPFRGIPDGPEASMDMPPDRAPPERFEAVQDGTKYLRPLGDHAAGLYAIGRELVGEHYRGPRQAIEDLGDVLS